jgi:hypothetical protein
MIVNKQHQAKSSKIFQLYRVGKSYFKPEYPEIKSTDQ